MLEGGHVPGAACQHLGQLGRRVEHVDVADIERRETEAQQIRGAEIADHAASDQRLHDRVALAVGERDLAAPVRGLAWRGELEP